MNEQLPPTKKKGTGKKIVIFTITAAAVAYGTIAVLNRDADPSNWKGERSGYEETK